MLTKEQKQQWIDALRSGEYEQGVGQLHHPGFNTYCCIGVFCKIDGKQLTSNGMEIEGIADHNTYVVLYDILGEMFGKELISMNDARHANFTEIADYIETNLETIEN